MKPEREKITGKVAAATLRLNIGRYELPPDEDTCYLLLVSEGSVTLEYESGNVLVNPGSAVLLGPGGCSFAQTGSAVPQIVGCHFPLGMLHDLKNTAGFSDDLKNYLTDIGTATSGRIREFHRPSAEEGAYTFTAALKLYSISLCSATRFTLRDQIFYCLTHLYLPLFF